MQTNQAPDQKNLIIAIALSIAIVLGFEFFYKMPRQERERALEAERAARETPAQVQQPAPGAIPAPGTAAPAVPGTPAARRDHRRPAARDDRDAAPAGLDRAARRAAR